MKPPNPVILPARNLPLWLPSGHKLLISATHEMVALHWFEGRISDDPYKTIHLLYEQYPQLKEVFHMGAWDVMLVLDLAWQYGQERGLE